MSAIAKVEMGVVSQLVAQKKYQMNALKCQNGNVQDVILIQRHHFNEVDTSIHSKHYYLFLYCSLNVSYYVLLKKVFQ